jgi:hypothetical protein
MVRVPYGTLTAYRQETVPAAIRETAGKRRFSMRIPINLLVFLAVAGVFYLVILPKRTQFVSNLMKTMGAKSVSREDTLKAMVEARILVDLCPIADLSEYRKGAWTDYDPGLGGDGTASITHAFQCDAQERKFLFRFRYGSITEIIDLR